MDKIIATMPIKPQGETNIGMLVGPTIMDTLGTILNAEKVFCMNTLNSYKDVSKNVYTYLNDIKNNGINYNQLFIDEHYANNIMPILEKMLFAGIIKVKNVEKYLCACGKVDMLSRSVVANSKLYHFDKGQIICNCCNMPCRLMTEKSLVLPLNYSVDSNISITPSFLQSEIAELTKKFQNTEMLISKKRKTGYAIVYDNQVFNIDIDFIWSNYFHKLPGEEQILIASNHQLFIMYFMNYLAKINSSKKLHFIATPYLDKSPITNNYFVHDSANYKKLFILYNLHWKKKDNVWSKSTISYLNSLDSSQIDLLYQSLIKEAKSTKSIDEILMRKINMQNNVKTMKRELLK